MRLAIVAAAIHAAPDDPFVPAWADMLTALARRADVEVFALRYPETRQPYRVFGASVTPLGFGAARLRHSPPLWAAATAAVEAAHRRRPFDAVVAFQAAEPGFVATGAALRIGRPLLVHVAGGEVVCDRAVGYGSRCGGVERAQVALALRCADVVTVGSAAMHDLVARRLGRRARGRLSRAPLGVDLSAFLALERSTRRPADPVRLLSVADFRPVKDHAVLLEAVARVAAARSVTLDLVGDGACAAAVLARRRRLGLDRRGHVWGRVPPAVRHLAYRGADVFVHASRHEAQGVALLEATAAGLAVATTAVGVAPSLPAATTWTAAVGDVAGLARAIDGAIGGSIGGAVEGRTGGGAPEGATDGGTVEGATDGTGEAAGGWGAVRSADADGGRDAARRAVAAAYDPDRAAAHWLALLEGVRRAGVRRASGDRRGSASGRRG